MKTGKKLLLWFISAVTVILLFPARTVSADMGPKPSVDVQVINPPDEPYYLDFLVKKESSLTPAGPADDSPQAKLAAYFDGEWIARNQGDDGLNFGNGIDVIESNDAHFYQFYYMVPDLFRIIIVTESGRVITTNELDPLLYNTTVTVDAAAGTLTEDALAKRSGLLNAAKKLIALYGTTCFCTVIIEGVIMLLFFLKMNRHDWLVFLLTQICTQILLYTGICIAAVSGYFLAELIIVIAEPVIYFKCMQTERRKRAAIAGVIANIVSAAVGMMPFAWIVIRTMRGLP